MLIPDHAVCTPTRYGILTGRYAWRSRLGPRCLDGTSPHLIEPQRLTVRQLSAAARLPDGMYWQVASRLGLGTSGRRSDGPSISAKPVQNGPASLGFDHYFCHSGSLDMPPYVYVRERPRHGCSPIASRSTTTTKGFGVEGPTGADFEHDQVLPRLTDEAVQYIHERATAGRPFFLYLALPAPHTPILPTGQFKGKSGTNAYGDFTLQVDDTVGRVMQALDESRIGRADVADRDQR